jgi:prolyl-tRNA editing enzyme YbaK/EbsC (Cys-tRNA(Pro) deacylase)
VYSLPPVRSIFDCDLVLDERLLNEEELFFNAGCLDRSFVMSPRALVALEQPTILSPRSA